MLKFVKSDKDSSLSPARFIFTKPKICTFWAKSIKTLLFQIGI